MKNRPLLSWLLAGGCSFAAVGGVGLTGCETFQGDGPVLVEPVRVGMTRGEVLERWGEPDERVQLSADQEWWGYGGDMRPGGQALGGASSSSRPRGGYRVTFDAAGVVRSVERVSGR